MKLVSISFVVCFVSWLNEILFLIVVIVVNLLSMLCCWFLFGVLSFNLWIKYENILFVILFGEEVVVMIIIG